MTFEDYGPQTGDVGGEQSYLRGIVARFFSIYEERWTPGEAIFFCQIAPETLEERFEMLRKTLKEEGYVPFLRHTGGEYVIHITRFPPRRYRSTKINALMLGITLGTTTLAGTLLWGDFSSSGTTGAAASLSHP
ncbi:MAG: hypothetical protein J7L61_04435, partial [Thermoplasmata archaeon]|nr:hypothetical protein [Thermoplasmata archaeon]